MDVITVAYIVTNIVTMLAIERIMGVFFEKRKTSLIVTSSSYIFYFVLSSLTFLLLNTPILNLFVSISTFFIITLNYESSIKKKLVATFGTYITLFLAETIVFFALGFYQLDFFYNVWEESILGYILLGAFTYMLALLLRRFKNIKKDTLHSPKFWIFFSIILVSTLIMVFIVLAYLPHDVGGIATIVIFSVNISTFYLHDILSAAYEDKLKSALHAKEKDYYFAQCQLMQESAEKVKTIRHDIKLHLATAADYNESGKVKESTDYLRGLLGDIGEKEIHSDTGNIAFDSIINFKLKTAAEDNIKIDVDVLVPPALNIEVADVVTILGNLLDNALDAVAKVEDKIIKLNIEVSKGNLFIKVDNTFDGEVKYAKGKDGAEKNIATRKSGDNHSYGLKNIRRSVEKYNGHVDINHDDKIFSVGVLMYVDDM